MIPKSVHQVLVTLNRKKPDKWNRIDTFVPITLLNLELRTLTKAKSLARVAGYLIRGVQTCYVLERSIQNKYHLIRYALVGFDSKLDMGGTLVYLIKAKVFDRFGHH